MSLLAKRLLWLEPIVLAVMLYIFWFPDPNRVWSLWFLVPLLALRWAAYGRLLTALPITLLFATLLVLGLLSIYAAPFSWGDANLAAPALRIRVTLPYGWVMLGRPLLGMALFFALVEHARVYGIRGVVISTVLLGLVVASMALIATQWNTKSNQLRFIIDLLPVNHTLPLTQGGFNANEIAGALAWLAPACAAFALYRWRPRAIQVGAAVVFFMLVLALFLGQSRLALIGVSIALAGVIFLLIPAGAKRYVALAALACFVAAEVAVATNVFNRSEQQVEVMQERDEITTTHRFAMWKQALNIVRDYPLTGVGMNLYRNGSVRARYPVPTYENRVLPHAHNEYLQVASDFGLPGLAVYLGLYLFTAFMVWRCWQTGDRQVRVVAVAAAAGLVGHAVYGMGDAVALWDRFAFIFWWLLGVAAAQYAVVRQARKLNEQAADSSGIIPTT